MTHDPNPTDADGSAATGQHGPSASERQGPSASEQSEPPDGEIDRRRLIRWVAVLAFAVPVVIELLTFGGLLGEQLLPGEDGDDAATADATATSTAGPSSVGVGDELLPEAGVRATVETSEVRESASGSRTYVLGVAVENTAAEPVELRLTILALADGTTLDSVSSTGPVAAGGDGEVTGAWALPTDSMPESVNVTLVRGGSESVSRTVALERPPIRG